MSRPGFFNIPGQSIFREATSRFLVMVMFHWMPIAGIFLHSFYIVVSYLGGGALYYVHTLADPLQKSETESKGRSIFLEITMLLKEKIDKTGTHLMRRPFIKNHYGFGIKNCQKLGQIQNCKFSFSLID